MELYQIKTLLKWIIVEKCIALSHGTIQCYIVDGFGEIFILGLSFLDIFFFFVFLYLPRLRLRTHSLKSVSPVLERLPLQCF